MLHLSLLGGASLQHADGSSAAVQRRPLALLAFVAAAGPRGTSREKALAIFWPDDEEERARHSLAQTLYSLRRACDADVIEGAAALRLDSTVITTDVAELEAALAAGEPERAAALYTGAFLDGFHLPNAGEFERWTETERTRLRQSVARALESCAKRATDRGDHEQAASWWSKLAALDPLDGRVALALARALVVSGDTAGAIKYVQLHQTLRRTELGIPPEPALSALVQQLRSAPHSTVQLPPASSAEAGGLPPAPAVADAEPHVSAIPTVTSLADRDEPVYEPSKSRWRSRAAVWGSVIVLIAIVVTAVSLRSRARSALNGRRVVVAVFENQTSDTTLMPLGDMTADWISSELARTGLVEVVDSRAVIGADPVRSSAKTTRRETAGHMRELARGVGAGIVVWGSYYRTGDSLEFNAHVTDVRDGALLREIPPVLVPLHDPMRGVQQLASHVMGALATIENPRLDEWATRGGVPPSYDAYREFVDGLEEQVHMNPADALVHYKRARVLDSTFLQPLLFAADAEHTLGMMPQAEAALESLTTQRDRLIPADRYLLDVQLAEMHGEPERGYEAAREMARLSPTSESFVIAGQSALYVARPAEALAWLKRVNTNEGWVKGWAEYWMEAVTVAHMSGNDTEALRLAHEARSAFPDQLVGYICLSIPLAGLGQPNAVLAEMDSARSAPGHDGWRYDEALDVAASELAAHGDPAVARQLWQRAISWYDAPRGDGGWTPDMRDMQVRVLVHVGRGADAERLARILVGKNPGNPAYLATLGIAETASGDSGAARAMAVRLARSEDSVAPVHAATRGDIARARARLAAAMGSRAAAVASLSEALRDEAIWIYELHEHVIYRPLQDYPPFRELARARG